MSEEQTIHSAAQSAAGYLYQTRLALVEALRYAYVDSGIEIAVEKFDDVSFEKDGSALELLQTKHHLKKAGDLTDSSVDLWKTLRVWAAASKADPSLPGRTRFALVTTAQAPTGSAASHLRLADPSSRDPARAEAMLMEAGETSKNTALAKAFAAFKTLTPELRKTLVAAIHIIDGAPLIGDIESMIENQLRMIAPRGKAPLAREQLEGWWWPRICAVLQAATPESIPVLEVEQKLDGLCLAGDFSTNTGLKRAWKAEVQSRDEVALARWFRSRIASTANTMLRGGNRTEAPACRRVRW